VVPLKLKARDAWWTVFVIDPIAGTLVRAVYPVRAITPNRLTFACGLVAAAAVVAFAADSLIAAALLFQASFVIDCMDGKLAFTREQASRYGGYFDVVADTLRFSGCAAALAYALAPSGAGTIALLALYPSLHYGVILTGKAWPDRAPVTSISVAASPLALLRAASGRAGKPGSTVDAEACAFTIGPLIGHPVAGVAVAVAFNAFHLLAGVGLRTLRAARAVEEPVA
jgi:phosphatidylglycerophosphate synthase